MKKLKKFISFLSVTLATLMLFNISGLAYFPKGSSKADGARNILLVYTGYYNQDNYNEKNFGDWDKQKFMPYVAHLNQKGRPTNYFFDSFVFLATASPYGGSLSRYYSWVPNSAPGKKADWQWSMDRMFVKNQQLEALDKAVNQVNAELGNKSKKVNAFLSLPFPDSQCKDFGDVDQDGISEDLTSVAERDKVVKWYVDEASARFRQAHYKNLKLSGFYWLQEDVDPNVAGEGNNVRDSICYLHTQGLKLGWVPWNGAMLKGNGNDIGFDFTLIQPNHYFDTSSDMNRIADTADLADSSNEGVEIELDQRALTSQWHRQAVADYLIGGTKYGYMNHALTAYYQDVYGLYDLYHSKYPAGRQIYDDIYHFSQGTYEAPMGSVTGRVLDASGTPVQGAAVTVGSTQVTTDGKGNYRIDKLYAARNSVTVTKPGYMDQNFNLNILKGTTITKDIQLSTIAEPYESVAIDDFEEKALTAYADPYPNGSSRISINTDMRFVKSGKQSLKADFTPDYADVRVYLGGDNYPFAQKDWSKYNFIAADVYNPSDELQYISAEFLDGVKWWGECYSKRFALPPNQWTTIRVPISDMAQAVGGTQGEPNNGTVKVSDLWRMSFAERNSDPYKMPNTLYIDHVRLTKNNIEKAPDYYIDTSATYNILDLGQVGKVSVKNKADGGNVVGNARFTSSDPSVVQISASGNVAAKSEGSALISANVNGIVVESVKLDVSKWRKIDIKPQNTALKIGKEYQASLDANFDNGFSIPFDKARITWQLSNDRIVKISEAASQDGAYLKFKANRAGPAQLKVTVTLNGKTMTKKITVHAADAGKG